MPKTKGQSIFFTAITAWMMVYAMTLYNTVLAMGEFTNSTFLIALKGMWIEYIIIFLLAYFVSGNIAKYFAFRVVQAGDRPIVIFFHSDIYSCSTGSICKYYWSLSRIWFYKQFCTELSHYIL